MRSVEFAGRVIEEGANWVQGLQGNPIWSLARKVGLKGTGGTQSATDCVCVLDAGVDVSIEAAKRFEAFDDAFESVENGDDGFPDQDIDFAAALAAQGWDASSNIDLAVEYLRCDFEYAELPALTSVHHNVHEEFKTKDFGEGEFLVDDPRGFVTIAGEIPSAARVHLGAVVQRVERSVDGSLNRVTCRDGRVVEAKVVLCTVSVGVLRSGAIEFVPALPAEKMAAVGDVRMANYTKVFAQLEGARCWSEGMEYILRAGPERGRYVVWQPLPGSDVVMVTCTGDEGRRVEGLSNDEVAAELTACLEEMYPASPPRVAAVHVCRWSCDPFFCGAYSFLSTGALRDGFGSLAAPVGPLFFAGEATHARYSGYLQGALLSGEDAAKSMLDFLGLVDMEVRPSNTCSFYVEEAKRLLARHKAAGGLAMVSELQVSGSGRAVSLAASVAEELIRQELAVMRRVETSYPEALGGGRRGKARRAGISIRLARKA